jgi:uncharacterized protein YnzC (UPF0291/DUF896 family)
MSHFPPRYLSWRDSYEKLSKFDEEDKKKFYGVKVVNEDMNIDSYLEDIKQKFSNYFRNCTIIDLRLAHINRKPGI